MAKNDTQDLTDKVEAKRKANERAPTPVAPGEGLSGDGVGEETLDRSGPSGIGSSGALGWLGSPGRNHH
ncbi:MAG: hypothetical protein EOP20_04245 [Hyphomicrobiales bacterium]|nr:MAG: hypothetical protein EOP20_04245 [Hyphomicrobiales bacterium]